MRPSFPEIDVDESPEMASHGFTMVSLHCQNAVAKKRSIALNTLLAVRTMVIQEGVDMVAGDFDGASWRRRPGPDQQHDSTLEEAFKPR